MKILSIIRITLFFQVILVSSASGMPSNANIVQKSITVPVVKTTASIGTSTTSITRSITVPGNSIATNTSLANLETQTLMTTSTNTVIGMQQLFCMDRDKQKHLRIKL